jgi:cyclopropane fatty-acyl-phospholipid synthase-like methyltransferase
MCKQWQARRIVGIDINSNWLASGKSLAEREGCSDSVTFAREIPVELEGNFDVAMSIGSFEHFGEPASILKKLSQAVKPGGIVVVTFAEPWYSHSGSHMSFFTKVPWVNLWFSEKTVMRVRSRFRNDGATRYEEVEGGLNRMTLQKFERIINSSGMKPQELKFYTTKGLPLVDKIPLVREFLVGAVACILRRPN